MASSRRSASSTAGSIDSGAIRAAIRAALDVETQTRVGAAGATPPARIAVAFSGGLDSTVLLHAVTGALPQQPVVALHVHHRLQTAADAWPAHCAAQANAFGVEFEVLHLQGAPQTGDSVEQWARDARYEALARAALRRGAEVLLTAHHADDQVETLLIRLGRGAGTDGLVGIEPRVRLHGIDVVRPLLGLSRSLLRQYAEEHGLQWIEDPSNSDQRFARNALRLSVLPAFETAMPGVRANLLRSAEHWRDARDVLQEIARADLDSVRVAGDALCPIDRLSVAALPPARRALVLRAWLAEQGADAPSASKLREMQAQLIDGNSAYGMVLHGGRTLLRYRDRIVAIEAGKELQRHIQSLRTLPASVAVWHGEEVLKLADGLGALRFRDAESPLPTPSAVSAEWLRGRALTISAGSATSARIRPEPDRPSRSLKNLYQEQGVPTWLRPGLPLLLVDDRVLYSAAFGIDQSSDWPRRAPVVTIDWEPGDQWPEQRKLLELFRRAPPV